MVRRLTRLVALVRRALALTIVASIGGAIVYELLARQRDRIRAWFDVLEAAGATADWMRAGAPQPGPRSAGRPDWHAARRLADEAELYALHPIDLTATIRPRPADATE